MYVRFSVGDGKEWTVRIYILESEASVCATVRRYFPAPYDKREHTGHGQQQAASQASTDSACRHPVWLPHMQSRFPAP